MKYRDCERATSCQCPVTLVGVVLFAAFAACTSGKGKIIYDSGTADSPLADLVLDVPRAETNTLDAVRNDALSDTARDSNVVSPDSGAGRDVGSDVSADSGIGDIRVDPPGADAPADRDASAPDAHQDSALDLAVADLQQTYDEGPFAPPPTLHTLALLAGKPGGGGNLDGIGSKARFYVPSGVISDGAGNLYVSDGPSIRKIVIATGVVTTLAGAAGNAVSKDGIGANAGFVSPAGLTYDGAGNLFLADRTAQTIRKIVIATGAVTTLAGSAGVQGRLDGTGSAAHFYAPQGIDTDGAGNLYVADTLNHAIRKVVIATGEVTTLAGTPGTGGDKDGTGTAALFYNPAGVASDRAGNLYVADAANELIRKIVTATGQVTTLAGPPGSLVGVEADGIGPAALFNSPFGITYSGGSLFVVDSNGNTLRKIEVATVTVTTLAGLAQASGSADGTGAAARFNTPLAVTSDGAGNLFVADDGNATIRKVVADTGVVTTLAGAAHNSGFSDGTGSDARFWAPHGMTSDDAGNLFVADYANDSIRKVVIASGAVTTLVGTGKPGSDDRTGTAASFDHPEGLSLDGAGNLLVSDSYNSTIRKIVLATGVVTTLAGSPKNSGSADGTGSLALFNNPEGLWCDRAGNLFVSDNVNHTIRKIVLATAEVTTLAGTPGGIGSSDGAGAAARFNYPMGISGDGAGNLYVADGYNRTIRKVVIATGTVTTLAGSPGQKGSSDGVGATARFDFVRDVAWDGAGGLFITDSGNNTVRWLEIATRHVTTLIGVPGQVGVQLGPVPGSLNSPTNLALGQAGELFISNDLENVIVVAQ